MVGAAVEGAAPAAEDVTGNMWVAGAGAVTGGAGTVGGGTGTVGGTAPGASASVPMCGT